MDVEAMLAAIRDRPAETLGKLIGFASLLPLHDEWIRYCWDKPGARALMAYRGSYKTSAVIITGIIRHLLFHPNARIGLFRKTYTDAAAVIRAISTAFDKPEIRAIYKAAHGIAPRKTEASEGRLRFNFKATTSPEPSLMGFGIDSAVTGTHLDVVALDDFITLKDRVSLAEREKTKECLKEIAANIVNPGSLVIFLGTKWAKDDAWSYIETMAEARKYPVSTYNFLPDEEIEEKRRRLTPFLFAINYELELAADEGLLFQNPKYGCFDPETWRAQTVSAHLDAAYGGGDYCALTIMAGDHAVGWLYHGSVQNWYGFIRERYDKYHCSEVLMETNADKGYVAGELRRFGLNTRTYFEDMNKAVKISTYLYTAWSDLIWDYDTDPEYMAQVMDWRPGAPGHDDAPDSAASLCRDRGGGDASEETLKWLFGRRRSE
jgi:hypothetical protein